MGYPQKAAVLIYYYYVLIEILDKNTKTPFRQIIAVIRVEPWHAKLFCEPPFSEVFAE